MAETVLEIARRTVTVVVRVADLVAATARFVSTPVARDATISTTRALMRTIVTVVVSEAADAIFPADFTTAAAVASDTGTKKPTDLTGVTEKVGEAETPFAVDRPTVAAVAKDATTETK